MSTTYAPTEPTVESGPTVSDGIVSGLLGAGTIAGFFLVVDFILNQPFWTPSALGTLFVKHEVLAPGAAAVPELVAGYSLLHAIMFVGFGLLTTYFLQAESGRAHPVTRTTVVVGGLFLGFQAFITFVLAVYEPLMIEALGTVRMAVANALAATVMGAFLLRKVV